MYSKKRIILIFVLIQLVGQASSVEVEVIPPTGIIIPGGYFDLNIRVDPLSSPIAGIQANILYDSSLVKINTIRKEISLQRMERIPTLIAVS